MPVDESSPLDELILREIVGGRPRSTVATDPAEPELAKAYAAYQKLQGLFDMLRRPAQLGSSGRPRLQAGMILGEFTLMRNLGAGGMGTVFLARQESLQRYVAVKVCKPELSDHHVLRARFEAEAQVLAQLKHPNIVPVHASGIDQGYLFLAMEYIDGPTLADVLDSLRWWPRDAQASEIVSMVLNGSARPPSNWSPPCEVSLDAAYVEWVVTVMYDIALALAVIHSSGLIHLDVKPSNIVFDANGEPKLVDFGLAMADPALQSETAGKGFIGTPEYASPEQLHGNLWDCSPTSDVYSFGATLYECLSLRRPFTEANLAKLAEAVTTQPPIPLRRLNRRIRWELDAIVNRCLEKQPNRRYRNGAHLSGDLLNLIEARPLRTRSTLVRRLRYWAKAHPTGAGVCAFLVVLVVVAALSLVLEPGKAKRSQDFRQHVNSGDARFLFDSIARYCRTSMTAGHAFRQQAVSDYTAALVHEPESIWLHTQRGILQLESGEFTAEA